MCPKYAKIWPILSQNFVPRALPEAELERHRRLRAPGVFTRGDGLDRGEGVAASGERGAAEGVDAAGREQRDALDAGGGHGRDLPPLAAGGVESVALLARNALVGCTCLALAAVSAAADPDLLAGRRDAVEGAAWRTKALSG